MASVSVRAFYKNASGAVHSGLRSPKAAFASSICKQSLNAETARAHGVGKVVSGFYLGMMKNLTACTPRLSVLEKFLRCAIGPAQRNACVGFTRRKLRSYNT